MKNIVVKGGYTTQVSDEDYDYFFPFNWSLNPDGYVWRYDSIARFYRFMHHEVLLRDNRPIEEGKLVEHKDRNKRNNQRDNLIHATPSLNQLNREPNKNNTSGFKGVYLHVTGKWHAKIRVNRKLIHLGSFSTPEEAAKRYDQAVIKLTGKYAYTNFPQ